MSETLICPSVGDNASNTLVSEAQKSFVRASRALDRMLDHLDEQPHDAAKDVKVLIRDLKDALKPALAERERLESAAREEAGVGEAGYAIDFTAARLEIGRRLACLEEPGSEAEISG